MDITDPPGQITWHCVDDNNRAVAEGIYWLVAKNDQIAVQKIILVNR